MKDRADRARPVAVAVLTAVFALAAPAAALAEAAPCHDPDLRADAADAAIRARVCQAAMQAKALMTGCGLEQLYPINIAVVDRATHPSFGDCLAVFDQRTGCLSVTAMDQMPALLPPGDVRLDLPVDVLFAATIAHELAHALLQQTARGVAIAATEQEFVANAFEMEALDPVWRDRLLAANPVNPRGSMGLVHLSIYALDPRAFDNNAWTLFHQPELGCSFIAKIAAGKARLPRR